jgi:hypothetical protein
MSKLTIFIEFAFREDGDVHSLPEKRSLLDEIDDCEATNARIFTFTTKKKPIIVTVRIDIIF